VDEVRHFFEMIVGFVTGFEVLGNPLVGAGVTAGVLVLALILIRLVRSFFARLEAKTNDRADSFKGFQLQEQEILSGRDIAGFLILVIQGLRLIVTVIIALNAVAIGCRMFRWTEHIYRGAVNLIAEILENMGGKLVSFIPNLLVILIIGTVVWYLLRLVQLVFEGIGSGRIRIRGFYPEWAIPTFNIVRLLIVAFAIVIVFPYLPGADSPAFRGVSIFLGVLVSLGSTSAVGNVVAGVVLIYMRAFKLGDRVRISEIEGIVVERSLFVTRIRTPKNVEVAIPNARVMADHIVNFNAQARKKGLIHHTTLSIGYDVDWRQVRDLLMVAALQTEGVSETPQPFVRQLELGDFSVVYELNVTIHQPHLLTKITSDLHANILDAFNEGGVEIMSPEFAALRDGNSAAIPATHRPED
jgi:small-conductance mechanosensitive channel